LAEDSFPDETGPPGEAAPLDSGLEAPSPVLSQGAEAPAASDSSDPEEDEEEDATSKPGGMSLLAHLAELRRRIIYSLVCVFVLACAAWNFAGPILDLIMRPVLSLLPSEAGLYYTGLPDAFSINFKVSLWAGAVGGAPFCLYQLWAFVAPGLLAEERAKVMPLTLMATVLFLAGTAFASLVAFPMTFKFFLAFSSEAMRPLLTIDRYMSLVMSMVLAFALSFQLPLVLMFLSRLGIISSEFLRSKRGYAIVLIFILAAVLTPPDVISQIILAGTLIVLYEFSLFLVRGQERARLAARAGAEDGAGG
jgi:sec-independent protein translocase protein TatC